jgi:hypothetical protein
LVCFQQQHEEQEEVAVAAAALIAAAEIARERAKGKEEDFTEVMAVA